MPKFELTEKQIRTKVFSQYFGQMVKFIIKGQVQGWSSLYPELLDIIEHKADPGVEYKLSLKSIKLLTDEQAIKVAQIVIQQYSEKHIIKGLISVKERFDDTILIGIGDYDIEIDEDGDIQMFKPFTNEHNHIYSKFLLEAYQYLISEGFDVPQYLLGGKTLKEAGLATYEPIDYSKPNN